MQNTLATIRTWFGVTIPITTLTLFFEGMSVMLRAGQSVASVMENQAKYGANPELRRICAAAAPQLRNGASLCACLRNYERRFPEIVMCVLEVGEMSGGLADAAQRLADTFGQTTSAERKFKMGAYDPRMVLLLFCLIQFVGLIIGEIQSPKPDRTIGSVALSIGTTILATVIGIVCTVFFGRAVSIALYRWQALRMFVDTVKLALPRLGLVFRNLSAARWARSFAVLWAAGVNISTALQVSSSSTLNAHYERVLRSAAIQTRQGRSLTQCLAGTQLLPGHLLSVIATCEEIGRLDDALLRLATEMEREALARAIEEMNKMVVFGYIVLLVAAFAASSL